MRVFWGLAEWISAVVGPVGASLVGQSSIIASKKLLI
jgi:hypothetical protein